MTEWIEWKGGECPVPPTAFVEVRFQGETPDEEYGADASRLRWKWDYNGEGGDITAYRVVS